MTKGRIAAGIVFLGILTSAGLIFFNDGRSSTLTAEREDHAYVRGNPDAPVKVVEFSDFECPFCARLHPTLERIVEESDGGVAWEYRHFPLPNHRNAKPAAYASECIGRLAGSDAFWQYADEAFLNQQNLGMSFYNDQAAIHGISPQELALCVADPSIQAVVENDYRTAVSYGGRGTPYVIVVYEDGTTRSFSGALPYEQIQTVIQGQ